MSNSCPICVSVYTSAVRKEIRCKYCDKSACSSCCEKYLLETIREPHCMHCNHKWLREFLVDHFTKVFVNTRLKKHREDILLQREKSLLPQTMALVEESKRLRRISELEKTERELARQLCYSSEPIEFDDMATLNSYRLELRELRNETKGPVEEKERRIFTFPCPMKDCRGFLSSQWKCGLCSAKICSSCHTEEKEGHHCNPDDVESANLIKKECKRCPSCGINVFRYEGCPQMWCTNCHTGFNWNTLKIEKGPIHNPHYFEWIQQNREEPTTSLTTQCGERISADRVIKELLPLYRCITEVQTVHLLDFQRIIENEEQVREKYRIRFLLNELTERCWKQHLEQQDKKVVWAQELIDLLTMFSNVATDYLARTQLGVEISREDLSTLLKEVESLREYVNSRIENINRIFNKRFDLLDEKFIFRKISTVKSVKPVITRESEYPASDESDEEIEVKQRVLSKIPLQNIKPPSASLSSSSSSSSFSSSSSSSTRI